MSDTSTLRGPELGSVAARVAIIEDHGLLAQSLAFALADLGIQATVVKNLHPPAVLNVLRGSDLHLVLLDFDLGDAGVGIDLIEPITALGLRVVMLTGETDPITLAECVEAGAVGIISKSDPFERLIEHVTDVVNGRGILSMTTREQLLSGLRAHRSREVERIAPFERLTVRESEVLRDLIEGKNAETIATESYVSLATVRSHIKALLSKLDVNSQLAAVALARRSGWVPTPRPDRG
jgi:Response regulator containing a CheY-like receiver domain and an HTH DNA-binding domain